MTTTQLRAYDAHGLGHKLVPVKIPTPEGRGKSVQEIWNTAVRAWHRGELS